MLDQLQSLEGVEYLQDPGAGIQPGGLPLRSRMVPCWDYSLQGLCQYFEEAESGNFDRFGEGLRYFCLIIKRNVSKCKMP